MKTFIMQALYVIIKQGPELIEGAATFPMKTVLLPPVFCFTAQLIPRRKRPTQDARTEAQLNNILLCIFTFSLYYAASLAKASCIQYYWPKYRKTRERERLMNI